jgi:hypothetical protein
LGGERLDGGVAPSSRKLSAISILLGYLQSIHFDLRSDFLLAASEAAA